mmetsp:Transcript_6467/g.7396  ORF Transcript_6467/g.7396 Transcript_6467/m.7396 type:complete len:165 (+) Transcript_6467:124-618(+)
MDSCCTFCDEYEFVDDRVKVRVFSSIAGVLFAFAWWLVIDAACYVDTQNDTLPVPPQLFLPGVGSTLSFIILSLLDFEALEADDYSHHGGVMVKYQAWGLLIFAILLALTCISISVYILVEIYAKGKGIGGKVPDDVYPGVAIFIQSISLLFAAISMRLGSFSE